MTAAVLSLGTFGATAAISVGIANPEAAPQASEARTQFVALLTSVKSEAKDPDASGTLKAFANPPATPVRPRR